MSRPVFPAVCVTVIPVRTWNAWQTLLSFWSSPVSCSSSHRWTALERGERRQRGRGREEVSGIKVAWKGDSRWRTERGARGARCAGMMRLYWESRVKTGQRLSAANMQRSPQHVNNTHPIPKPTGNRSPVLWRSRGDCVATLRRWSKPVCAGARPPKRTSDWRTRGPPPEPRYRQPRGILTVLTGSRGWEWPKKTAAAPGLHCVHSSSWCLRMMNARDLLLKYFFKAIFIWYTFLNEINFLHSYFLSFLWFIISTLN